MCVCMDCLTWACSGVIDGFWQPHGLPLQDTAPRNMIRFVVSQLSLRNLQPVLKFLWELRRFSDSWLQLLECRMP